MKSRRLWTEQTLYSELSHSVFGIGALTTHKMRLIESL